MVSSIAPLSSIDATAPAAVGSLRTCIATGEQAAPERMIRFVVGPEAEGLFTLFSIAFFLIGIALFGIGLLGEYVGRIYQQVRGRPRFLIRKVHGDVLVVKLRLEELDSLTWGRHRIRFLALVTLPATRALPPTLLAGLIWVDVQVPRSALRAGHLHIVDVPRRGTCRLGGHGNTSILVRVGPAPPGGANLLDG